VRARSCALPVRHARRVLAVVSCSCLLQRLVSFHLLFAPRAPMCPRTLNPNPDPRAKGLALPRRAPHVPQGRQHRRRALHLHLRSPHLFRVRRAAGPAPIPCANMDVGGASRAGPRARPTSRLHLRMRQEASGPAAWMTSPSSASPATLLLLQCPSRACHVTILLLPSTACLVLGGDRGGTLHRRPRLKGWAEAPTRTACWAARCAPTCKRALLCGPDRSSPRRDMPQRRRAIWPSGAVIAAACFLTSPRPIYERRGRWCQWRAMPSASPKR
jgi:hypothetical protein